MANKNRAEDHYLRNELYDLIKRDESIFEFFQNGSLDGIWYWDLEDMSEEWMSERFWTTLGYDPSTKAHKSTEWQGIINQEDLAIVIENFERHKQDPSYPFDQTVRYQHADGGTIWIRCRGLIIRNDAGEPIRMLGAHNDITHLVLKEVELREAMHTIEMQNKELQHFAYIASHDLKSPLRGIAGFCELIQSKYEDSFDEEAKQWFEQVQTSAVKLQDIVGDLYNLYRAGDVRTEQTSCDLAHVFDSALELLSDDIETSGATVTKHDLPVIKGNDSQLTLLFMNLIQNAIKYRRPDRDAIITVSAINQNEGCIVRFEDNGSGVPERKAKEIFQAFTRLHHESHSSGTGMGLAICKKIVDGMNGEIWVEPNPDYGSTFCIKFNKSSLVS